MFRYAVTIAMHTETCALGLITGHDTNYHYRTQESLQETGNKFNLFEWRRIDHYPLLEKGKLKCDLHCQGHFALEKVIFINPAFVILNYDYKPLENQFVFQTAPFLLELVKYLYQYIDSHISQIKKYKKQVSLLVKKVDVCIYFVVYIKHKYYNQ